MRYRITGACRESGRDITVELDAADEADALQAAMTMNLLVAAIVPLPGHVVDEAPTSAMPADDDDLLRRLNAARAGSAPDYFWLKLVGQAYTGLGFITIAMTLLINLLLLLGVIGGGAAQGNVVGFTAVGGLVAVINIVVGVLIGAFILAVGQSLLAFRDIARNSWKLPQIVELTK